MNGGADSYLNYPRLREIQKKEMESLDLVKVDRDFYAKLRSFIESKKAEAVKSQSFADMRELENIRKVAKSIVSKRKEKLLLLAGIGQADMEGLAEEEQVFFAQVRRLAADAFGPLDLVLEEQGKEEQVRRTKVRFAVAVEAYKGCDNNIYGPFKEGEEAILPEGEAAWLLKNKMAEHIS